MCYRNRRGGARTLAVDTADNVIAGASNDRFAIIISVPVTTTATISFGEATLATPAGHAQWSTANQFRPMVFTREEYGDIICREIHLRLDAAGTIGIIDVSESPGEE